jgi:flagellin
MLAIKNNIMAMNTARYLGRSYEALASSVEKLSSGLRINSAKDDAAGLAVRELMRADIVALQQGARNAQDGISLIQTMEGAMQTIDDLLVRMKQLAEQAATGVYSTAQRTIMDSEFDEIAAEIDRLAGSTDFNGISMLDNSAAVSIHFGGTSDAINVSGKVMTTTGLSINTTSIGTAASAIAALSALDSAIATATTARADFGAKMNRLQNTVSLLQTEAENMQASESRISDVDVATEMAVLTRTQILAQAGTAMLAQANSIPQMALTLLR